MEPALFDNKLPVYVRIRPRSPRSRDIVLDGVVFYESYFLACSNYADSGHREANNMERAQRIFNSKWISVYTDFLVGYKSDLEKLLNLKEPTNDPYQEFITVLLQKEEKATHGITDTSTLLRPRSHYVTRVVVNQMLNTTTTERIQVKETGTVVAEMKGEIDAEQVTLDELERSVHAKAKIQAAAVKRYNSRVVDRFTRPRRANIESVVLRRSLISDMMNDPDQNIDIIENPKSKEGTLRKRVKEVMKAKKHESMTEELRQASHKSAQARNELGVLLRRHERVTDAGLKPAPAFLAEIKEARTRVEETKLEYDNLLAATNKYTEDMEAKKRAKKKRPHKKQTPESRARMLAEQEEEEIEIANTQE
jgi:RNase H-fold protein (predicted Holliday junction resolvase)